ncbi:hypothetical protein Hanom_Chr04g00318521 [Helianthus anomalus]
MEPFANKSGKFLLKAEDKKRKRDTTPKASKPITTKSAPKRSSKKKSPPHLVDEPDVPLENVNEIAPQEAEKAKNVEAAAGGETVKEILVKGVVHTDSNEIDTNIDVTQLAPTTYVNGNFMIKGPSRKKKGFDEEDAPYVPTAAEAEKLKRGRGIKRSAKPTGATPRKQKIRKTTTKAIHHKYGESAKAPEKVTVEEPIVEAQVHVPTPPRSPIHELFQYKLKFM